MEPAAPLLPAILVCVCWLVKPSSDSSYQLIPLQTGSMDVFPIRMHPRASFPAERNKSWRCFMKYAARMLVLTLTMLPLLATAQLNSSQTIVAQVPFEFAVGSKIVPSGEWIVQPATMDGRVLMIHNTAASVGLFSSASLV